VILAALTVLGFMTAWRTGVYAWLTRRGRVERLQRRTAMLGWTPDAAALVADLQRAATHPLRPIGWIRLPGDILGPEGFPELGTLNNLPRILREQRVDAVIAARTDLPAEALRFAMESCEASFVEWKVVPSSFQILTSGLRLDTVGRVPILGVEDLAIHRPLHRLAKRLFDLAGASVGLVLSAPWILVLVMVIRRESPGAPALFTQQRIGARQRPFVLYKLRSMHPEAAAVDHLHQSTPVNDPRLLRIGAWMRRWNLDELPQFWNVLKGDMSLVGPRPERPIHVARLSSEIPHYLPRHLVKPGLTGWAQVNGLRGEGDLARRIQHDIAYIENWSLLGDVQILLLTLLRWRNPGA
jgi:exopolysaccharide biosynthesis polyprenyl glycosylphosphotransferase